MYCENCGKEITGDMKFCANCGKALRNDVKFSRLRIPSTGAKLKWNKKTIVLCVLALVLVSAGILGISYLGKNINPMKHVSFEVSGFSSHGSVDVLLDEEGKLVKHFSQSVLDADMEELDADMLALAQAYQLMEAQEEISRIFDAYIMEETVENGLLSNGDRFGVKIEVDQELLAEYGLHSSKDVYYKKFVVGKDTPKLPEAVEVDFFEYVEPVLDGSDLTLAEISEIYELKEPVNGICAVEIEAKPYDPANSMLGVIRLVMVDEDGYKLYSGGIGVDVNKKTDISKSDKIEISLIETEWVEEKGVSVKALEKSYNAKKLEQLQ